MTKEEFLIESKNHEAIYGFMYGMPVLCNGTYDTRILKFQYTELIFGKNSLIFPMGGPESIAFKYEDYGLSWAFKKEDIDVEAALKKLKDRWQL